MGIVVPAMFVASAIPQPLPRGYVGAPLPGESGGVRVALVLRTREHPDGPGLVATAQTTDAQAYLAAVIDARGHVLKYLDLWFQDAAPLLEQTADASGGGGVSNSALDAAWTESVARAMRAGDAGGHAVWTGRENARQGPWVVDLETGACRESGWMVCDRDADLTAAGLPAFSAGLHRYLTKSGESGAMAAVWAGSPAAGVARSIDEALDLGPTKVCVNPWGGHVAARVHLPMPYGAMIDWLSGAPESDQVGRTRAMHNGEALSRSDAAQGGIALLTERESDPAASLVERTFLRLRLLHDCVDQAITAIDRAQRPLLNVDEDAVRVSVGAPGEGAAWAWTARACLVGSGLGFGAAVQVGGAAGRPVFAPAARWLRSVYSPVSAGSDESEGSLRLRSAATVTPDGAVTLDATLTTPVRLAVGAKDLLLLTFGVGGRRVTLTATWSVSPTKARNEVVVSASAAGLPPAAVSELRAIPAGKTFTGVLVRTQQVLGPACDLYALGVLGVRSLLVTRERDLGSSIDDIKSLAGRVADNFAPGAGEAGSGALAAAVQKTLAENEDLRDLLGPIRLAWGMPAGLPAASLVGMSTWVQLLAALLATQPGYPFSALEDPSSGPVATPSTPLHPLRQSLYNGLLSLRSRLLRGGTADAELARVLRRRIS